MGKYGNGTKVSDGNGNGMGMGMKSLKWGELVRKICSRTPLHLFSLSSDRIVAQPIQYGRRRTENNDGHCRIKLV